MTAAITTALDSAPVQISEKIAKRYRKFKKASRAVADYQPIHDAEERAYFARGKLKPDPVFAEADGRWIRLLKKEDAAAYRVFEVPSNTIHELAIKANIAEKIYAEDAADILARDIRRLAKAARKGGAI